MRAGEVADHRAHLQARADADEAEHLRLAHHPAVGALAGPEDHQPGEFGHHLRVGLDRAEEIVAGERQHLGIPQGRHGGRMRGAGDEGHLARRLAGTDHAQELRLAALLAAEGAQPSGAQQVEMLASSPAS